MRHEIAGRAGEIGSKARNLVRLVEAGFCVPDFVIIPSRALRAGRLDAVAEEVLCVFPRNRYAVRSAALVEDERRESYAGQFLTKLDVKPAALRSAIEECVRQAERRLSGDLGRF